MRIRGSCGSLVSRCILSYPVPPYTHAVDPHELRELCYLSMTCPLPEEPEDKYTVVKVPVEAIEPLRDAVAGAKAAGTRIAGRPLTLAWAITRGLGLVQRELELYTNGGAEYPPRDGELPRGHPWPKKGTV